MSSEDAITLKSPEEIEAMRKANRIVGEVLSLLRSRVAEGISTHKLDQIAEEYCRDHGAVPAFKGYRGYPASLCASINEEVVHGIPSRHRHLKNGDIISLDFGAVIGGYYGDSAITVPVGEIASEVQLLLDTTRESLMKGIAQAVVGNRISDISRAVQNHCEAMGFAVVREYVGHGIGTRMHEPPEVPNYVDRHGSPRLLEGMTIAIEPMVNLGTAKVKVLKDDWTVVTADKKPSAHFEHTVAITKQGPLILSARGDE